MEEFYNSDWFKSRPKDIQELLRVYPPMSKFEVKGEIWYLLGFGEHKDREPSAIISKINPSKDYEGAMENRQLLCNSHLENFKRSE